MAGFVKISELPLAGARDGFEKAAAVQRGRSVKLPQPDLSVPNGASNVGFIQDDDDAIARTLLDKDRDALSANDFRTIQGAVNAATKNGRLLVIEPNTIVPQIVWEKPLRLFAKGAIACNYNGRNGPWMHAAPGADGSSMSFNTVDYQNNGVLGLLLEAGQCDLLVRCARNMTAQDYAIANRQGVVVSQAPYNRMKVTAYQFSMGATGGANAVPRIITTDGGSVNNIVEVRGYQTHTLWVDNGLNNHARYVIADQSTDNGIYNLGGSVGMKCDYLQYTNGKDEPFVLEGKYPHIGRAVFDGWGFPGVQNCTGAVVDEILWLPAPDGGPSTCMLRSRDGNVQSDIHIGRVIGWCTVNGITAYDVGAFLHFYVGNVDLRIDGGHLRMKFTDQSTARYFVIHRGGAIADYGRMRIEVDSASTTPTTPMYWGRPTNAKFAVDQVRMDSLDTQWLKVSNTDGGNVVLPWGQEIFGSVVQNPSNLYPAMRARSGTSAPTSGTWNRGDEIYSKFTTQGGAAAWKCIEGGSPGTWKLMGQVSAWRGPTTSRPTTVMMGVRNDVDWAGAMYIDTTLAPHGKPIWWTGVEWVDATGTVV